MIPNIDKFSELEHNSILLGCRYLYASDQTAGHGLEWTKCTIVRNFHQSASENLRETSEEYPDFGIEMSSDSKN